MRRFFAQFANLFRGKAAERELAREIEAHLGLLQEEFERRGASPQEARLAARRAYGGVEQVKEMHRETRSFVSIENWIKDVRHGVRTLRRNPAFTLVAIVTLALGIGANTAIFSVVNAVLLRPLAYKDANRLVTLLHDGTDPVAPANYVDWRDQSHSFEAMGAAEYWSPNLTGKERPEHLTGLRLTPSLLPMLGIPPLLGRVFTRGEDQTGADHEVVLSYALWQRRFGHDATILGKQITLNGEGYTVVGVMPSEFRFAPFWTTHAELWIPLAFGERIHSRDSNSLRIFARLKPNVTLAQARAEMGTITGRLEHQYPGTNRDVVVTPLKENVVGKIQTPLLMVLGAVCFVLLIACANVSHMLLARTSDRQKEIAVRAALGAGRSRILSQFLTESLLLAALGSLVGFVFAVWGKKALLALSPAYIPRVETVEVDSSVICFLLGITALIAVAFGLIPAMHTANGNFGTVLKEGGRGDSDGVRHHRLRSILVASEFALAFMLLIGAGLLVRSFFALQSVKPGFDPHHVLSLVVSVAGTQEAEPERRAVFYRQLLQKVRSLPGVNSAGAINHLPLAGDLWGLDFVIADRPKPRPGEWPSAVYRVVMPGYFETMRLPLRHGRAITENDDAGASKVVIINERAAREYWPGQDPLGKRIAFNFDKNDLPVWLTVIGVVADAKQADWAAVPSPEVYLSALQNRGFLGQGSNHIDYITLVVRSGGNTTGLAAAVKNAVWSFDRNLTISDVLTMDRAVADATSQPRFEMFLLGVFAVIALLLAAVGIYGVMSYSVSRRRREIGIRTALGADRAEVLRMILQQGMSPVLAGTAVGITGALLLSQFLAKMLYGIQPTDPVTFAGVALVLGLAALLGSCVPARKALNIEPMAALRNE